ncbi:MAG TPA: class I SAM-dependent methyltransferase [Gallionella sp.]|nr:class I SAM-dependent methyltransferase [Gallionella sp.]
MYERIKRIAALANQSSYDAEATRRYIEGAPHIKHAELRKLFDQLVVRVFDEARKRAATPMVLDLGAGEGSATLPFLELGAKVVAVDVSASQLDALKGKCGNFASMLEVQCRDVNLSLQDKSRTFDIVVANSFLHHVPDYLGMIRAASTLLKPGGQFFSFQEPLRYDSVGKLDRAFSSLAYFSWRIFRADAIGGMQRRMRRARGIYLEDSEADNAEYHITRNGVDQEAIRALFDEMGGQCDIVPYFSTQSSLFQPVGSMLGVKNTFAVIARKQAAA